MRGEISTFSLEGRKGFVYLPPNLKENSQSSYPAVYCFEGNDFPEKIPMIMERLEFTFQKECSPFFLFCIPVADWERELTPWKAPGLSKSSKAFSGEAEKSIRFYQDKLIPFAEKEFPLSAKRENRNLTGYSLGGLSALYSLYQTDCFASVASLSGSLWYDGWIAYIRSHTPKNRLTRVYLSLGDQEEKSRNRLLSQVAAATRETHKILSEKLEPHPFFEWNQGGHFADTADRYRKALFWLMKR